MDGYFPGQSRSVYCAPVNRFDLCADALMEAHGGMVFRDPKLRGACMNGISLGMLSSFLGQPADVARLMRLDEALTRRIYRRLLWDEVAADRLPPGLDLAVLALALETGPHAAILALQNALGVAASGAVDEATSATLRGLAAAPVIAALFEGLLGRYPAEGGAPARALAELRSSALVMAGSA